MRSLIAGSMLALASLFMAAQCATTATPEAMAYDTLKQAANALDAKHALFEVEVARGRVPRDKEIQIRESYVRAKEALISASVVAETGINAESPEQVDRLVAATIQLITTILPPESR